MVEGAPVIAVTGSAGYVGSRLLQELENEESLGGLIAIDLKSLSMPIHNISAYRMDITQPLDSVFHDHRIDTMVHLAFDLRGSRNRQEAQAIQQNNLRGLENLLRNCRAAHIKNFVYLSSHTVYGAYRDNPLPITEEAPLRPLAGFHYSENKFLCEEMVQSFAAENPRIRVTTLRCCIVIGHGSNNVVAKALLKPILLGVMGSDPPLQFVHEDDLARLLALFSLEPYPGVFNVAGKGVIRYSSLARNLERRLIFLPPAIVYPLVQASWNLGLQKEAPAAGVNLIRYPILLSTGKLKRTTGFRFRYTAEEAVNSYAASNLI